MGGRLREFHEPISVETNSHLYAQKLLVALNSRVYSTTVYLCSLNIPGINKLLNSKPVIYTYLMLTCSQIYLTESPIVSLDLI